MAAKKKTKNRRNKRRHVLDVKAASNQIRKRRISMAVSSVLMITVVLTSVYILWRGGYWAAQQFVYKNKNLSVQHFEIRTDGVIKDGKLRTWAGVRTGDNLFSIDLHAIKKNLETHSMIRKVALERVLPDTLRMRVSEREPVAQVRRAYKDKERGYVYQTFAFDRDANAMTLDPGVVRPETAQLWKTLPWITTSNFNGVFTRSNRGDSKIASALKFVDAFNSAEIGRILKVREINIDDDYILRVLASNGATVDFLSEDFDQSLKRWQVLHTNILYGDKMSYVSMDLSVTNYVPVRRVPRNRSNSNNSIRQY